MEGLTLEEMTTVMVESGMGKDEKTTSVILDTKEKLQDFRVLKKQIEEIESKGGMVDIPSD